jgi:hypothetical protein
MITLEYFSKEEIIAALKARSPILLADMLYYCIQIKYDLEFKKLDKKIKLNLQKQKQLFGIENIHEYVKISNQTDRLMEKEEQLSEWYDKAMKEILMEKEEQLSEWYDKAMKEILEQKAKK